MSNFIPDMVQDPLLEELEEYLRPCSEETPCEQCVLYRECVKVWDESVGSDPFNEWWYKRCRRRLEKLIKM